MKIERVETLHERIDLVRPYRIAYHSTSAADMFWVRLVAGANEGLGAATPVAAITGESVESCAAALRPERLEWLVGRDLRTLRQLSREVARALPDAPGACAAVDTALHDLFARQLGLPLVEYLGRVHDALPTSITVGIKSVAETVEEAKEQVQRGFDHLKIKLGLSADEDRERLTRLREDVGRDVKIRVDANQGYDVDETVRLGALAVELDLELIEQPLPAAEVAEMRKLPREVRERSAADENLHGEADAVRLLTAPQPFGIWNIKLMKCGGIGPAMRIAAMAHAARLDLMWGCMDESVVGITAALHAAYASPATRYIDLDGSLDLSRELAEGGFVLDRGRLRILDGPGLGVRLRS